MTHKPTIACLAFLTEEEAEAYMTAHAGDELAAAQALAQDRHTLAGSPDVPDETEVHHALYLLRRARGLSAASFDLVRVKLRDRAA